MTSTGACPTDNTCLQTSDFGVVDNSDWKVDLVLETLTSNTVSAYSTAVSKWQGLITGDVASISTSGLNSDSCARAYPAVIDDIHICGKDEPIDGPGKILGSAGPSYLRTSDGTSICGNMRFDSADVQGLITGGNWEAVILHEMGVSIAICCAYILYEIIHCRLTVCTKTQHSILLVLALFGITTGLSRGVILISTLEEMLSTYGRTIGSVRLTPHLWRRMAVAVLLVDDG